MYGIKRKYTKKSTVKRGRKAQEWRPIDLDPEIPVQFAGDKGGFVWFRDAQRPFTEWQMLDNGTVNVKLHVKDKRHDFGMQFVNLLQSDISIMPT